MRKTRKRGAVAQDRRVTAKINEQIGNRPVRLVAEDGTQLGVMDAEEARTYAYARELDLVEVAAGADPPVCRVLDYGKWRYEEERKLRAARRNQVHVSLKEVQLRPKIGSHDYAWKRDRALGRTGPASRITPPTSESAVASRKRTAARGPPHGASLCGGDSALGYPHHPNGDGPVGCGAFFATKSLIVTWMFPIQEAADALPGVVRRVLSRGDPREVRPRASERKHPGDNQGFRGEGPRTPTGPSPVPGWSR